jgi:hypothetical protein
MPHNATLRAWCFGKQQRLLNLFPVAAGETFRTLVEQIQGRGAEQQDAGRNVGIMPAFYDSTGIGRPLSFIQYQHFRTAEDPRASAGGRDDAARKRDLSISTSKLRHWASDLAGSSRQGWSFQAWRQEQASPCRWQTPVEDGFLTAFCYTCFTI